MAFATQKPIEDSSPLEAQNGTRWNLLLIIISINISG